MPWLPTHLVQELNIGTVHTKHCRIFDIFRYYFSGILESMIYAMFNGCFSLVNILRPSPYGYTVVQTDNYPNISY